MPPLLFVVFNRPDHARITFERIRQCQPSVLYVAADAPRVNRAGEAELTEQTRKITQAIDWPCEVHRLYADTNMGCGRRISSAISHVLDRHESAIILEDDCVPDLSFFGFCDEMLQHYADDARVMSISGDNFQKGVSRTDASYYFSKYPHCWGWATWRRAWHHFDLTIAESVIRDPSVLDAFCETSRERQFWGWAFEQVNSGMINTWDFQWTLCCWLQNGLTVLPNVNLVSNIGCDEQGTNTLANSPFANLPTDSIDQLIHPPFVYRHADADRFTDDLLYSGPWQRRQKKRRRLFSRSNFFPKRKVA